MTGNVLIFNKNEECSDDFDSAPPNETLHEVVEVEELDVEDFDEHGQEDTAASRHEYVWIVVSNEISVHHSHVCARMEEERERDWTVRVCVLGGMCVCVCGCVS